jgi:alkylation response protein AidB-like acyl-CoA dehydrogenase
MRTKLQVRGQIGVVADLPSSVPASSLEIFEGTQQIQQLIVARRLLGKTSAELK